MDVKSFNKSIELNKEQFDKYIEWIKGHRGTCPHTSERMAHAFGTPISFTF